jgi:hypothetical protein
MLKVAPKTLSQWRNGKSLPKAAIILIKLVARVDESSDATSVDS